MKLFTSIGFYLGIKMIAFGQQQCEITVSAHPDEIYCGQEVVLTAYGKSGTYILNEDFNTGGFGPGWSSTPGATSFSNPCSPGGVDGTPHAWMDANTSVPRTLTSASYDISMANAGVTICFDLLFARQAGPSPCEGPDLSDEGVYLQYSTDGGVTWNTIHYFNPNGGYDPQLINWNNWCFQIPAAAITSNTMFRWHQIADSGAQYDHWGIDNIQIVINDEDAEIIWLHDGYSYGLGNAGGNNPTPVTPITDTTYTAQLLTGDGQTCTASVSVIVKDPIYHVGVDVNPDPVCEGDCGDLTGVVYQVIHPGGITKYENYQTEDVSGGGFGTIGASVDLNVQGLNTSSLTPGMITEVCIDDFSYFAANFFGNDVTVSDFEYKLVAPGGCGEIILIPSGTLQPSSQSGPGLQSVCFVVGGATNIGSVSEPYSGTYSPDQPFDNLVGCDPNGLWTLEMTASIGFSVAVGLGSFEGWSITFDNPPIYGPANVVWDPAANMANPNQIDNQVCPPNIGANTYSLTVSNGVAGCATSTETITVMVDPCNGCDIPQVVINPLVECIPNTVDLEDAIDPSSEAATLSYHNTQADAQNDVNAISNTTISSSGTYWVRIEDPAVDTCFTVQQITVTISSGADASFTLTDFCPGGTNAATNIATPGGAFTFNPVPSDGATINSTTGAISGGVPGTTYSVEYTVGGSSCTASNIETVQVFTNPVPTISGSLTYCPGSTTQLDAGSGYTSYVWQDGTNTQVGNTQVITSTAVNGLTVTVVDANGCSGTSAPVNVIESNEVKDSTAVYICSGETILVHGNPVSSAGVYTETYAVGGCDSISIVTVIVMPAPQAVLDANPTSGDSPLTVEFTNNSVGATSYDWYFLSVDSFSTTTMDGYIHTYDNSGVYTVILVAHSGSCSDTAIVYINVDDPEKPLDVEIPNVFTPNGDGINDFFVFNANNIAELDLIIVNRWGNLVYETDDINFMWDGRDLNGNPVTEGVYFYKYKAIGVIGDEMSGHGFVTVER